MADPHFYSATGPYKLSEIAEMLGGELVDVERDRDLLLSDLAPLGRAQEGMISFFGSPKYRELFERSQASACLVPAEMDLADFKESGKAFVKVDNVERRFADLADHFYPVLFKPDGVSEGAHIHETAKLEEGVTVKPGAVVSEGAEVGAGSFIGPNCVVGPNVKLGRNCILQASVTLMFCFVGDHVMIGPGSTVGSDGYGFSNGPDGHRKIPQLGRVIIQDWVEIGANSSIDRGAGEDTVVGEGTKIDNLVHVAHNCKIGRHCLLAGCVGLSGSTVVGDFVVFGGQAATAGHLTIDSHTMLAARSGVIKDVKGGGLYGGFPLKPYKDWRKEVAAIQLLIREKLKEKKK